MIELFTIDGHWHFIENNQTVVTKYGANFPESVVFDLITEQEPDKEVKINHKLSEGFY